MTRLSQPIASRARTASASWSSSSGVTTSPATFMRSSISMRRSRGISGSKRAGHAVGLGPRAPAELEGVAEAARGDEPDLGHLALEHGVGGGGGAVDDEVEIARAHARLRDRRQHAVGLVGGGGRDLGQLHAAALRPRLVQQQVRERPAHVDASHPPHARPRTSAAMPCH